MKKIIVNVNDQQHILAVDSETTLALVLNDALELRGPGGRYSRPRCV